MKKLILVLSAVIVSFGATAQTDSLNKKMNPTDPHKQENTGTRSSTNSLEQSQTQMSHPDGYMMENGRMVYYKGGKSTMMESTQTLSNGTKIMSDGTYMTSDGRKMTLQNGEHLGMDGNLVPRSSRGGEKPKSQTDLQNDKGTVPDETGKKSDSPR